MEVEGKWREWGGRLFRGGSRVALSSGRRPGLSSQTWPCGGQQQFLRMIPGGKQVKPSHERAGHAHSDPRPPHGTRETGADEATFATCKSEILMELYGEAVVCHTHNHTSGPKRKRFSVWLHLLCTAQSLSLSCTATRHLKVVLVSCCRQPSLFCLCWQGGFWSHWVGSGHAWRGG